MVDIPDYYDRAVSLLASQFQIRLPDGARTNFQKMIYAISTQSQFIQDQINLLDSMRSLDTAQGVQLDGLGQIIGLARVPGQPDDSAIIDGVYVQGYRESLQFQIFINQSSGTPEQVIAILKFLTQATKIWYNEVYPAAYQMATNGLVFPPNPSDLVAAIQSVSPAAVNFIGVTATYNTNPFVFSNDPFDEQLYVAPNIADPLELHPFQVDPGAGNVDLFINRGQTTNPDFGGGFAEAIWVNEPTIPEVYVIDTTGAGQLAEVIMD